MSYAATIGFFDGVHKGHLFLLSELKRTAAVRGLRTLVVTFKEHPRLYLGGERPLLLTSTEDRVGLISACGIDDVKVLDFPEVRSMRAVEFMRLLHDKYDVRTLLMGYDHNFGSDGIRGIERYSEIGRQSEIDILPVPRAPEGGVSSSKIRMALLSGDVKTAVEMLGRPYSLTGKVVKGKGVGHSIGFPTANIQLLGGLEVLLCNVRKLVLREERILELLSAGSAEVPYVLLPILNLNRFECRALQCLSNQAEGSDTEILRSVLQISNLGIGAWA